MKDSIDELVLHAVATHTGKHPRELRLEHRLTRDLSLFPLDVVLIGLRIEEGLENGPLPFERLDTVHTVGDLTALLTSLDGDPLTKHS
jgi:hypothetical protein